MSKKSLQAQESHDKKRFDIKGGSQEMAVMIG